MNQPKKSLGQHWLDDPAALDSIIASSGVEQGNQVLEIGPGHGSLTKKILEAGATVTAVELDDTLALQLVSKVKPWKQNLRVVNEDIL